MSWSPPLRALLPPCISALYALDGRPPSSKVTRSASSMHVSRRGAVVATAGPAASVDCCHIRHFPLNGARALHLIRTGRRCLLPSRAPGNSCHH